MDKETREQRIASRYADLGGLETLVAAYSKSETTLSDIAAKIGFSIETVRNDIRRHLKTKDAYQKFIQSKVKPAQPQAVTLDAQKTLKHVESLGAGSPKFAILKRVLDAFAAHGIEVTAVISVNGGLSFYLSGERSIAFRLANVGGEKREHQMSMERFKIAPGITSFDFAVFAIEHSGGLAIFIFRSSDIAGLQSLNLRYSDKSKYEMVRKSKYDFGRDNWKILTSVR